MAKIIDSDTGPQSISSSYSLWQIAAVGLALGLVYLGLTPLLKTYISSDVTAGDISTILVATLGVIVMIRLDMAQPLIIAIATGVALWGLSQLTSGLVLGETVFWTVAVYMLAYILFSWISRYVKATPVLVAMFVIVIAVRIASNL